MQVKTGKEHTTLSDINVTPFVDVLLVILIIFMISAPMLKMGIEVNLPESVTATEISAENAVVVTVKRGKIIAVNGKEVKKEGLLAMVREEMKGRKCVLIEADAKVLYEDVIEVLDLLRKGGFTEVGLVTEGR